MVLQIILGPHMGNLEERVHGSVAAMAVSHWDHEVVKPSRIPTFGTHPIDSAIFGYSPVQRRWLPDKEELADENGSSIRSRPPPTARLNRQIADQCFCINITHGSSYYKV